MPVPDQFDATGMGDVLDLRARTGAYHAFIVETQHPPEVEAALAVACELTRHQNDVYVEYLRGKGSGHRGRPTYERQSPRWRTAEEGRFASVRTVAAILGALYGRPDGQPPILQVQALIDKRLGPLCNGWREAGDDVVHHPNVTCPVHGQRKDGART